MRCQVTYKLGSGCKKLQFYCPQSAVDLINKDQKKCRKGDVMVIGKKRWVNLKVSEYTIHLLYYILHLMHFNCRFCKSEKIREEIQGRLGKKRGLKVLFTSDRRRSGAGAQCTAQCVDPAPATGQLSECSRMFSQMIYFVSD